MRKRLALFLAVILLFAGIGLSLHHHNDGYVHEDCPVCVVATHHLSLKTDAVPWAQAISLIFVLSIPYSALAPELFQTRKNVRSPPF
jgi:hypothetical protein